MAAFQHRRALQAHPQKMERTGNAERLPPATDVAKQLTHDTNLRKAIDWTNTIGPDAYLIDDH